MAEVGYAAAVSAEAAVLLVALGFAVGVFGTLVGAGGGFILSPVLLLVFPEYPAATVSAISLLVVFFNAASGSLAYGRQRRIDYRSGIVFALATLPGAVAGALLVTLTPRRLFAAITAVLLLALSAWLLTVPREAPAEGGRGTPRVLTDRRGHTYRYAVRVPLGMAMSTGVGLFSSFLGIGGGILHVPLLVRALGFPVHIATATSHFVLANMAVVGSATHAVSGDLSAPDALYRALVISAGVIGGAPLGAWISQRLHGLLIQRLLAGALGLLALRLLVSVL